MKAAATAPARRTDTKIGKRQQPKCLKCLKRYPDLYLMMIPGLAFLILFKYVPMYGLTIAFQDFNIFAGITGSPWVGWANFEKLIGSSEFYQVFTNTLLISVYKLIFQFPVPILFAVLLNEMKNMLAKRTIQTVIYLPHFLSWVVVSGLFTSILSTPSGLLNQIITALGGEPIAFMMEKSFFRSVVVTSTIWKDAGYGAIVYIAAITGIDQEIYEAARVDGAGRIRQIIHITIPGLSSTIVLMFILRLGQILNAGTEQILMMYNPVVYEVGDVIGTYVYRMGIGKMDYSFSTAVGLFESVVGFLLLMSGNFLCRKLVNRSIW
ncbi:ABC transporter permease [Ructibacterium gallinarum]|uniref:Sugar ABC transporter permease n=1 Tax=Ructibacterium gallinarum TaxID=2779355 RepID=A0A9D5LY84_9FIRM|nr:ABC transporter permease subunit [Ructibacterium gallinarum]MBE5040188.1 sugar ABC transporter permease [Ructibacterium gallinarum]